MKKSMRMRWISLLAAVSLAVAVPAPVAAAKTGTASSNSEAESDSKIVRGHPKAFTFRGLKWGSTLKDVKASGILDGKTEGVDTFYDDDEDCLFVGGVGVADKDASAMLYFNSDGQFCMGVYSLDEQHFNSQNDYLDFRDLETGLTEKYGDPSVSKNAWTDDMYKGKESRYGMAIALGELALYRRWDADDSSYILLSSQGDNAEISTIVAYFAPESIPQRSDGNEDDGL